MSDLANRLLSHCPSGPLLDHLAKRTTQLHESDLKAAPSDDVARKLVKRSAESALATVPVLESPELLTELVKKEKRITVIRALAANPHLPTEGVTKYAALAVERWDSELAMNLVSSREQGAALELVLATPQLGNLAGTHVVLPAIRAAASEATATRLAATGNRSLCSSVLQDWLGHDVDVPVASILELAIAGRDASSYTRRALAEKVAPHTLHREALLSLGWDEAGVTVLEHALKEGEEDLAPIVRTLGHNGASTATSLLSQHGVLVDTELAAALTTHTHLHTRGYSPTLTCTPAGAHVLASRGGNGALERYVSQVTEPQLVKELVEASGTYPLGRVVLEPEMLKSLWEALVTPSKLHLLATNTLRNGKELDPALRAHLLARGEASVVVASALDVAEAEKVLERDWEENDLRRVALHVLQSTPNLPTDVRRRAAAQLETNHLLRWLEDGWKNPAQAGDLAHLARNGRVDQRTLSRLVRTTPKEQCQWSDDVLELAHLAWDAEQTPNLEAAIARRLMEAFGEDLEAWDTVLTLLPGWTGTLPELVETVQAL